MQLASLAFIAGIIVAVSALEYYGYLKHSKPEDTQLIESYQLLALDTQADLKISPKSSGRIAFCANGYLLLRPDNGKDVAGILVDSKKRGITCQLTP